MYEGWGYVVLRFDMRGCGESGGTPGRILCPDQVADTRNALSWLAARPDVVPDRVAVSGQSHGGAVAVHTGGVDERVAAVISLGGSIAYKINRVAQIKAEVREDWLRSTTPVGVNYNATVYMLSVRLQR